MSGKILVTGGSGFIGSNLVQELWKREKDVAVLCRHPNEARRKLRDIEVDYLKGDVRDRTTLVRSFDEVDTVVHCVQFPNHPIEDPKSGMTYEKIDGEGTRNLIEAIKIAGGVKRIIYVSGAGTREGRPNIAHEPWFKGKLMAEKAIAESGIPYTILRPSWIYGREDRSLNRFIQFARTLPFVPLIGPGTNRIQPLFIRDFIEIVIRSLESPATQNQIYEVGGPEILTMNEIVQTILAQLNTRKPILHQPVWLMKIASTPLQFLKRPPLTPESIEFIMMEELVDNKRILEAIGSGGENPFKLTKLANALATYLGDPKSAA